MEKFEETQKRHEKGKIKMDLNAIYLCLYIWFFMIVVVIYMKADIDARIHPVAVEKRYQKWLLMNTNFLAHANQTEFDSRRIT
jgi:hypothetical protein